jgi:hypothetical protein
MPKSFPAATAQAPDPLNQALRNIQSALVDTALTTGTLGIAGTTSRVRTSAAVYSVNDGVLCLKASTDNLFILSGTVNNATFNVFVMTLKADGTATARMGTAGASLAAVVFPQIPAGEVVIGFVIINPTGTGNFVGGTTALNDGTVVPNAVYVNTPYPFNPNVISLPNYGA